MSGGFSNASQDVVSPIIPVDLDAVLAKTALTPSVAVPVVVEAAVSCRCGKDGSARSHGAIDGRKPFTCDEVMEIGVRMTAALEGGLFRRLWRRVFAANCGTCGSMLYTNGTCPICDRPRNGQILRQVRPVPGRSE